MISVAEARVAAAKRLRSRSGEWAGRLVADGSVDEGLVLGLKPPTEAQVLADRGAAQEWVRQWREADGVRGCAVDWEHRAWSRVGGQHVPVRVRLEDPAAVAAFAGGKDSALWTTLAVRVGQVRGRFVESGRSAEGETELGGETVSGGAPALGDEPALGGAPARGDESTLGGYDDLGGGLGVSLAGGLAQVMRRHRAAIAALSEAEFAQVLDAAAWLAARPVERMRPRQMPLRGVDSKWFARHRSLVSALHAVLTGGRALDILDPEDRVRIRILGENRGEAVKDCGDAGRDAGEAAARDPRTGGDGPRAPSLLANLTDLAAPVEQIAALPLRPRLVIVSENLESMLALPDWDGVVAVHGSGYAVSVIERIDWLRGVPVLYWGDLDSHGFAILHRLRTHLPAVTSVLMDEETLVAHRDLWVREEKPHRGAFDTLTGQEARALARVRTDGDVRLEQERIPWEVARARLEEAVAALSPFM